MIDFTKEEANAAVFYLTMMLPQFRYTVYEDGEDDLTEWFIHISTHDGKHVLELTDKKKLKWFLRSIRWGKMGEEGATAALNSIEAAVREAQN